MTTTSLATTPTRTSSLLLPSVHTLGANTAVAEDELGLVQLSYSRFLHSHRKRFASPLVPQDEILK